MKRFTVQFLVEATITLDDLPEDEGFTDDLDDYEIVRMITYPEIDDIETVT